MKVDILGFSAHPDDIEISCGGTVIKSIKEGKKVAIVDLTQGELGSRGTAETRKEEATMASEILGLTDRTNLKLRDGFFTHNEDALMKIIEQIRYYQPEIIIANSITDRHPDHGRASKLISEACFYSGLKKIKTTYKGEEQIAHRPKTVYHYIQDRYIEPDFVVDISEHIEQKMKAMLSYKTQFYDPNSNEPNTPISGKEFLDFLYARMREFGRPIGAEYAEGFTVERLLGVKSLFDLQ